MTKRPSDSRKSPSGSIDVRASSSTDKPVQRPFPGPRGADAALRVAIDRRANADLVAHAKESLDAEVCGVLIGQIGEDDEGKFVHVEAIIRGNAASGGATHVTFTQATWDAIHETLEKDFPKLRIMGWYHTHPGFGVEFSEMDIFIQRNFFSSPTQIALVTDPTDGRVAIATSTADGIQYLPRFWIDGREQTAHAPAGAKTPTGPTTTVASDGDLSQKIKALEERIGQLIQAQDDHRTLFHQLLTIVGLTFCVAILGTAGYLIYQQYKSPYEPPRLNSYVPVPIKIGDKSVLLGVGVVEWNVPPELNNILIEVEKKKQQEAEKLKASLPAVPSNAGTDAPPAAASPSTSKTLP